jgi:hypothetical protein
VHPDGGRRRWRLIAAALVLASPLLATGCSVPAAGVVGVGLDELGRPVGYLRVCHDHIDGTTLYHDDSEDLGSWSASEPVTDFARWSLADPAPEWRQEQPLVKLTVNTRYTLYGGTDDNSWSAEAVDFSLADLGRLEPGQVLYWGGDPNGPRGGNVVATQEQFKEDACRIVG